MLIWEYKVVKQDAPLTEEEYNELGAEGWMCFYVKTGKTENEYHFRRPKDKQYQNVNTVSDYPKKT